MPAEKELDRPIWGVEAIAEAANLTPRQTYRALVLGYLPGAKAGKKWFTTPRRLLTLFAGNSMSESPSVESITRVPLRPHDHSRTMALPSTDNL
jgi:hypothetical protein